MTSVKYEKHKDYFDKRILFFIPVAVVVKIVLMLVLPEEGFLLSTSVMSSLAFGAVLGLGVAAYGVTNDRATLDVALRNVHRVEDAYGVKLRVFDEGADRTDGDPSAEFAVYRATEDVGSEQRVVGLIPAADGSGLVRFVGVLVASEDELTLSMLAGGQTLPVPEPSRKSALSSRIEAGLADPISDREKALVSEMTEDFKDKYGRDLADS